MISPTSCSRSASLRGIFSSLRTAPSSRDDLRVELRRRGSWRPRARAPCARSAPPGPAASVASTGSAVVPSFASAALGGSGGRRCRTRACSVALASRLLHPLAELHPLTACRKMPAGAAVGRAAWGASRRTSWSIASETGGAGVGEHHGSPWFSETGTDRELGIATSTLMPTVRSMAGMVSPVRASARLSTKCQRCWGLPITCSASISFTVARMLGTSVAETEQQVGRVLERRQRVLVEPRRGVDHDVLERLGEQPSTCSICSTVMSSASVGVAGAHRTNRSSCGWMVRCALRLVASSFSS